MRAFQLADSYCHCCLGGLGCHGTGRGKMLAFSLAFVMDKEEIIVIISPLSSLMIEQMVNIPISAVAICRKILSRVF